MRILPGPVQYVLSFPVLGDPISLVKVYLQCFISSLSRGLAGSIKLALDLAFILSTMLSDIPSATKNCSLGNG